VDDELDIIEKRYMSVAFLSERLLTHSNH